MSKESVVRPASFLVHVSSSENREIHAFLLDSQTGSLKLMEVVAVPSTGAPTHGNIPLTWDRDGKVLYAQVRTDPFPLSAFAIEPASDMMPRVFQGRRSRVFYNTGHGHLGWTLSALTAESVSALVDDVVERATRTTSLTRAAR